MTERKYKLEYVCDIEMSLMFDNCAISGAIANLSELVHRYPDKSLVLTVEHYDSGVELILNYRRLETDNEYNARKQHEDRLARMEADSKLTKDEKDMKKYLELKARFESDK